MKLAIISHTEHYKTSSGTIVGWGPTINEINNLTQIFDEIYHVAMLKDGVAPPSALPYSSDRIHFVQIPNSGGRTIIHKLGILWKAPKTISTVFGTIRKVDVFQFRAPTGIGVYLIPLLLIFTRKKGWFKYAGNWNQSNPPLGYRIQRYCLKNQSRMVTINGQWDNQPKHCLTFENPCLTAEDIKGGITIRDDMNFNSPFSFCFVGRLEKEKGVLRIIEAFSALDEESKRSIHRIHFVGDGKDRETFESIATKNNIPAVFHGFLSREQVFDIYGQCHFFLLPSSASEGFPKVIAEAMNFGCIPLVSNVSSIGQYIHHEENGFIINDLNNSDLKELLNDLLTRSSHSLRSLIKGNSELLNKFTYSYYNRRIAQEVIGSTDHNE